MHPLLPPASALNSYLTSHFGCSCFYQHSLPELSKRLHQQFESYKEQVRKIGEEARRYQGEHKDDAPTCGICLKTKFADGCGHLCSYCRTKFCARCGGRVSLRSNNVMWEISSSSVQSDRRKGAEVLQQAMGLEQKQISSRSRSEPPRERKKTLLVSEQNGKGGLKSERKRVPKSSLQQEGQTDDRERKERHESRKLDKGRSQDYPDLPEKLEEGKVADEEKQRKEDEYHTRYRSDPNLARYPVKPHPEEQQMQERFPNE
ncbi:hypothetical protein Y1Q_0013981 [Alligator mississippiensis]|uniref:RIM zinc finger domain-containing protein n=1 Tax=Alligator mississippiensis TaxID=8496 RepID=A0A151PDE4_ALLMI|nr:hypothetical protein Y1Q_0013981 [Alligator mississippiensis]